MSWKIDLAGQRAVAENESMTIKGHVRRGVVVLEGGVTLPEGTPVTVSCDVTAEAKRPAGTPVQFPLVHSKQPGTLRLTGQKVAELLEEEDVSS